MATTWSKREREKKEHRKEKEQKRQERKELNEMIAYLDANGNLTSVPPDTQQSQR